MMSLVDLNNDAQSRRVQLTQYLTATNPPSWVSFTSTGSGFQVVLSPPVTNSGAAYLSQGAGLDFPSTSNNNQTLGAPPIFFYQVQLATDNGFTQNLQLLDMGTSPTMTISATGNQFARARARFANSPFSQWVPFSGTATTGPTYRPFEFATTLGGSGSVSNPFQGMDGNTSTFAQLVTTNNTDTSQIIYGPFQSSTVTLAAPKLTVISSANGSGLGGHFVEYSIDAGGTFTTIRTGSSWAQTTDVTSLSANLYIGLVRVRARIPAVAAATLNVYETFIQ